MMDDEAYRDHVSRLRRALAEAPSSLYSGPPYDPERRAAHADILDDAWAELGGDEIPKGRQGLVLAGVPGSGKTTVRSQAEVPGVGPVASHFLPIDPDYFKGKLIDAGIAPSLRGFSPMEAAPLFHKESNDLAKALARRAYEQGTNVAWDYSLRHPHSPDSRLGEFARYGYTPHGIYVHADPATALARVTKRHRDDLDAYLLGNHRHGGRYVPVDVIGGSLSGGTTANRKNYDAMVPHLATSQIFDTTTTPMTRQAMPRGRPKYLDNPDYVPPWTPKKPTYCACGNRWLPCGGSSYAGFEKHRPIQPGTPEHNQLEEDDFTRGRGWATPENPYYCSCGDLYERDHGFMGPSHRPTSHCHDCGAPWDYEHSFMGSKHRPGWNFHAHRTAEISDQPLNVRDNYTMADFFQWCAHNRKNPDRDNLAQYAAISGMNAENYLDIYLFLGRGDELFRTSHRTAILAPGLKYLYGIADIMKHTGMDAKSLRGYIERGEFPSPTHVSNSFLGYSPGHGPSMLWDSLEPWEKWHAKYKKLREEIPLYHPSKKGWQPLPEGWSDEFKTEDEPTFIHSVNDVAKEFGVGASTVLSWYKRKNISSKPPIPTHMGVTGSNNFWGNMDAMREWFKKYKKNVVPAQQGGSEDLMESKGQHDLLQQEMPLPVDNKPVVDMGGQAKVLEPGGKPLHIPNITAPAKPQATICPHCFTQHAGECL